jgi:hypothetical protein
MGRKVSKSKQILAYVSKNPNAKPKEIGLALGIQNAYVSTVMWNAKRKSSVVDKATKEHLDHIHKTLEKWKTLAVGTSGKPLATDIKTGVEPDRMSDITYAITMGRAKERIESSQDYHLPTNDPVNHPSHYKVGGIETIDFIEAKKLNYNLGNVVKYLTRADHKGNRKQDLEKALWYLSREIDSST